jgi:hypothetical protein
MTIAMQQKERRRRDLSGRILRAVYPARAACVAVLEGFPCNIIGHRWQEIPALLRRSGRSDGSRLQFRCRRCGLVGGFTA